MATVRAELQNEELSSLRALSAARSAAAAAMAPEHRDKLVGCGYAAQYEGTLHITPVGQAKLVYETTRQSWFPALSH
jgi:hypothetical protein